MLMTLKSLKQKLILYLIISEWALGTANKAMYLLM